MKSVKKWISTLYVKSGFPCKTQLCNLKNNRGVTYHFANATWGGFKNIIHTWVR